MKKLLSIILVLIFSLTALLTGCDNSDLKTDSNGESSSVADEANTGKSLSDASFWAPFSFTENQAVFAELIKDNPIDKADRLAQSDGTTQGMMDIQYQFADIWMEELEYSIDSLTALLNQEDKLAFEKTQDDWEKYLSNNQKFLNSVLIREKYGQMISIETAYEYKNEIRNRALYVKYLQFILDDSNKEAVDFKYGK